MIADTNDTQKSNTSASFIQHRDCSYTAINIKKSCFILIIQYEDN